MQQISYAHQNDPKGPRFCQFKQDPVPPWAVDIQDYFPEVVEAIKQANTINDEIKKLYDKIDELLDPICKDVLSRGDINEVKELIPKLPDGFHRSELRTWVNEQNAGGK